MNFRSIKSYLAVVLMFNQMSLVARAETSQVRQGQVPVQEFAKNLRTYITDLQKQTSNLLQQEGYTIERGSQGTIATRDGLKVTSRVDEAQQQLVVSIESGNVKSGRVINFAGLNEQNITKRTAEVKEVINGLAAEFESNSVASKNSDHKQVRTPAATTLTKIGKVIAAVIATEIIIMCVGVGSAMLLQDRSFVEAAAAFGAIAGLAGGAYIVRLIWDLATEE